MYRLKQLLLLLSDLLLLYLGLYLGVLARAWSVPGKNFLVLLPPMTILFGLAAVINFVIGLYDLGRAKNTWGFYKTIGVAALAWVGLGVVYFYISPSIRLTPKTTLLLTALFGFGLIALWRLAFNRFLSKTLWTTKMAMLGWSPAAAEVAGFLLAHPEIGYTVVGVGGASLADIPLPIASRLTVAPALSDVLTGQSVDLVVVVNSPEPRSQSELYPLLFKQTGIVALPEFYEIIFGRVPPFTYSESWFIGNLKEQQKKMYDRVRILIDYLVALSMGAVFIATFPLLALLVKATSPGPIFFRQRRVGRLGREFTIYKYRTMQALSPDGSAELAGPQLAADRDTRITPLGRWLRRTRLDELPQFWNILRGEMALVGPRPERPEFVAALQAEMPYYALRHLIKPGLTGWAQIHRSYYGDIAENLHKLEYDLFYLKHRGALLDLAILLRTINIIGQMGGR